MSNTAAARRVTSILRPDESLLQTFWHTLVRPGDVHEVRVLKTRRNGPSDLGGTASGYFNEEQAFVKTLKGITGDDAPGVYLSLNPVNPALLARSNNRLTNWVDTTTADQDIVRRTTLLVDIDSVRPSGISATVEERDLALEVREAARAFLLEECGWPHPLAVTMSGNGGGLLYRIDIPHDAESTALVANVLRALETLFRSERAFIDTGNSNASRLTKVIGSVAAKGENMPDRSWRIATATFEPSSPAVPREALMRVVRLLADTPVVTQKLGRPEAHAERVAAILNTLKAHGVTYREKAKGLFTVYALERCLTSTDHTDGAALLVFPSGAIVYKCHHASCTDKSLADACATLGINNPKLASPPGGGGAGRTGETRVGGTPVTAELLLSQDTVPATIRPGQDFMNGVLVYGVRLQNTNLWVPSNGNAWTSDDIERLFTVDTKAHLPGTWRPEAIRSYRRGDRVSLWKLIEQVERLFREHFYWRSREIPTVLALWVFGTYVFTIFRYYGYLWFNSPGRRCGKSNVLDLLSLLCFHATNRMINPSPAILYRDVGDLCRTAILDEVEGLRSKNGDTYHAVNSLLNAGFQAGSVVSRMEKVGKDFATRHFPAYSPKALAGISRLEDTVEDRCFKITMWRKRKTDGVARLNLRRQTAQLAELRDGFYQAGLAYAEKIARQYDDVDELTIPQELDDRARDIFEPLFTIAAVVERDREANVGALTGILTAFALEQAGIRASDEREGEEGLVVRALAGLRIPPEGFHILPSADTVSFFRSAGLTDVSSKKKAGEMLGQLGLHSQSHRIGGQVIRGYKLVGKVVEDLAARFCDGPASGSP